MSGPVPDTGEQIEAARRRRGADREQRVLEIIETSRGKQRRFKDDRITMAHGAGGKATQSLIEGLLLPAFAGGAGNALADLGDAGVVELGPPAPAAAPNGNGAGPAAA
ncbi:MAG: hypothetical protein ACR2NA_09000, partial [Solirubrobacterales bacterium]